MSYRAEHLRRLAAKATDYEVHRALTWELRKAELEEAEREAQAWSPEAKPAPPWRPELEAVEEPPDPGRDLTPAERQARGWR